MTMRPACLLLVAGLLARPAHAQVEATPRPSLPAIDLGQTNIVDAEGGPGALLEIITFGSIADRLVDGKGKDVPGRNRQRIASLVLHPILVSEASLLGAHPGMEVLLPLSRVDNDFAMGAGRRTGLGDITVAPFLQWSGRPMPGAVSVRLAMQFVAPTGDYSRERPVNTGQGAWQLSPYLAVTWRASERWELSARAIYDAVGRSPGLSPTGERIGVRPGKIFALNYSTSYAVTDRLRLGAGGYLLEQLSDSRSAGQPIPDSRAQVVSFGPVSRLQVGKAVLLLAAFGEFAARNRPAGATINLRLQQPF